MIRLTGRAGAMLGTGSVLVFDWHAVAMCCAAAGEVTLRAQPRRTLSARYRPLPSEPPGLAYAARAAYPHLVRREVRVDGRRRFGFPSYSSDLPGDFGLRVSLGRDVPAPDPTAEGAP